MRDGAPVTVGVAPGPRITAAGKDGRCGCC